MFYGKPKRGTSLKPMTIYVQMETFGEIRNKIAINFTVCGME